MKWMILLSLLGVSVLGIHALAQQAGDAPAPAAQPALQSQGAGMGGCGGAMMGRRGHSAGRSHCRMAGGKGGKAAAGNCPMGGMKSRRGQGGPTTRPHGMVASCMGGMRHADGGRGTMNRMRVMMHAPIFLNGPYAIYGQAAALKLSEEQKARLMEIAREARRQALAVLTEEQRKKLGDVPDKPVSMMQLCRQMCASMKQAKHKDAPSRGGAMMMCPMMRGSGASAAPAPGTPQP